MLARLRPRWLRGVRSTIGLRLGLGIACALLVLAPALAAAELIVRGYARHAEDDARGRLVVGLDSAAGLIDQERVRTAGNAEVAGERLGPPAQQGESDDLVKGVADTRTAALRTSLVAVVDGSGRTLASDPASNLPFGTFGDVKAALQGKLPVGLVDRNPGIAVEAAAPLRGGGQAAPGAVLVAQNLDDGFWNAGLKMTGLDMAIVQGGQVRAASRDFRRSLSFAPDQSVDADLLGKPGDSFKSTRLGNESFLLAARAITVGSGANVHEIGVMLVGLSADALARSVREARLVTYGGAVVGASFAGLLGGLLGGWLRRRLGAFAKAARAIGSGEPLGPDLVPTTGSWGEPGRAFVETSASVGRLRAWSERLEAVVGSMAEGVIVADARQQVVLVNPAARALLSLPAGGEGQALALISRAPSGAAELVGTNTERVIRSYSATVRDGDGVTPIGTVTVLRDATREQELDRLKSEFLMVVSHELQTPLTAIKGALELVLDDDSGQLSRVQRRFLDTIDRNSARLVGLVGDLLDLSRLEAGRVELDPQPLDTTSVVRGAVSALANLFDARGTVVQLDVPDTTPPILGDRRRVEQVLTNLLANAAKYTPAGGQVDVIARGTNGRVTVTVADSGPGVPEAERDIVFDKFYRGSDAIRRGEGGSGLGLAIVKSLVELHGGAVRVAGGPGNGSALRGARFVVEFPRAPDDGGD